MHAKAGVGDPPGGVEPILRLWFEEGRRTYGSLPLPFEVFIERVLGRVGPDALKNRPRSWVGADLFLAIACDEGIGGAWQILETQFRTPLLRFAQRYGATRHEAEELVRDLQGDLFSPPASGRARTRIGTYEGSGRLITWMGLLLVRRLVDRWRMRRRHEAFLLFRSLSADPGADLDPEKLAIEAETEEALRGAVEEAWGRMSPREILVLGYAYRDRLRQGEIARLLGVTQPTASRILQRAREKLRAVLGAGQPEGEPDRTREWNWASLRDALGHHLALSDEKTDNET